MFTITSAIIYSILLIIILALWWEPIYLYFFGLFQPKWKKEARSVLEISERYLKYKRDLLVPEKKEELETRIQDLKQAFKTRNKEAIETSKSKLLIYAETFPNIQRTSLAENVEVLFVLLAVFFGIRTYIAQPFRIPTGSMQPSLNGIQAFPIAKGEDKPSLFEKGWNLLTKGSSYEYVVADRKKTLVNYSDATWFLFTKTRLEFDDGSSITVPSALGEAQRLMYKTKGSSTPTFEAGEEIVNARFDAGDLVIVDRMSYNFRHPQRGEVFVFDTRGIEGIHRRQGDQAGGVHYIKRLVGTPGDKLQVKPPLLIVNGKPAEEPMIDRVQKGLPPYNQEGYLFASPEGYTIPIKQYLPDEETIFALKENKSKPYLNEYAALGDNTTSSLDSRFWGPVKQYNIVGTGFWALWPFTSHWGPIP